jgi:hypothetical protein
VEEIILSKRKRRHRKSTQQPSQVFFTVSAVHLLKEALCTLEEALLRTTKPSLHIPFAKELVEQLKIKLDNMLQMENWEKEIPFDYNEIHILYAAVHMHLIELKISDQESALPMCILLYKQLGRMVEEAEGKQR